MAAAFEAKVHGMPQILPVAHKAGEMGARPKQSSNVSRRTLRHFRILRIVERGSFLLSHRCEPVHLLFLTCPRVFSSFFFFFFSSPLSAFWKRKRERQRRLFSLFLFFTTSIRVLKTRDKKERERRRKGEAEMANR